MSCITGAELVKGHLSLCLKECRHFKMLIWGHQHFREIISNVRLSCFYFIPFMSCHTCIFEGETPCFNWIFDFRLAVFVWFGCQFFLTTRTVCTCSSANNLEVNIEPKTLIFHWGSQLERVDYCVCDYFGSQAQKSATVLQGWLSRVIRHDKVWSMLGGSFCACTLLPQLYLSGSLWGWFSDDDVFFQACGICVVLGTRTFPTTPFSPASLYSPKGERRLLSLPVTCTCDGFLLRNSSW